MSDPPLAIQLFGPFRVRMQGVLLPRLRTRSLEWLLALLVLRQGGAVDRSWLAGTLWPDSAESQALHNLRDALVHLRKALGSQRERLQSPTRDTLTLVLEGADADVDVDVVRFDHALRRGTEEDLRQAVAVYTGPLLEGCSEEWVFPERTSREQALLQALEALADRAEQRREYSEALRLLRRAQEIDALRDTTRRGRMRVLAASGDTAAALHAYREYRLLLQRQMQIEPDEETVRLYQQIRKKAGQQPARFPDPAPPDTAKERTSASSRPPFQGAAALPHPLSSLIGREQEIVDVAEAVSRSRLVTLVGGGGVGKTRLAMESARDLGAHTGQEVAFVALAPLSDPALLPAVVATALGIREETGPLVPALARWLSTHPILLLLDNGEHLIEAVAALTQTLLEHCPDLHVLITSRQRLGLTGEVVWRVPSLPVPAVEQLPADPADAVAAALTFSAFRLFAERAASAHPEFRLARREEVEAVCRICRRLDGIPLAIELAAARVRALTVEDIHGRLDHRFRLLTNGSRAALPRQQTLRSLIDWSYDLLTEAEKALLSRASVFSGGWTLEAMDAIAAEPEEALDLLTNLADKSLVLAETSGAHVRYRMLETVRQYARDRLQESGAESEVRGRHLALFLALAESAEPHLKGPDQQAWMGRLETEHDNLRAALEWALAPNGGADAAAAAAAAAALRICGACARFWQMRGHFAEGRRWCDEALGRAAASERTADRAKALAGAGSLAYWQSELPVAKAFHEESLSIRREIGDRAGIASSLSDLGGVEGHQAHVDLARELFQESLALRQELGDVWGIALCLNYLAYLARDEGDLPIAWKLFEESLTIRRGLGDRSGIATSLRNMGSLALERGDDSTAKAVLEESLDILRELGDRWGMSYSLDYLGMIAMDAGDHPGARRLFAESLSLVNALHDRWGIVTSLTELAVLAAAMEAARPAARLFGAADRLREEEGSPLPSNLRPRYEKQVAATRAALGNAAFDAAWQEGRAMTLEQAVRFALTEV